MIISGLESRRPELNHRQVSVGVLLLSAIVLRGSQGQHVRSLVTAASLVNVMLMAYAPVPGE